MDFKQRQKNNEIYQKVTKKLLQRQNINSQINSRFTPLKNLKIGTYVLIPNLTTKKKVQKKYNHSEKIKNKIHKIKTKNCDFVISHENITKHLSQNLKY